VEATSLVNLGDAYNNLGYHLRAIHYYQESLKIQREIRNRQGQADSLFGVGDSYLKLGRIIKGISASQKAKYIYRELGLSVKNNAYSARIKKY